MLMDFGSKLPSGPSLEHNSYIRVCFASSTSCTTKLFSEDSCNTSKINLISRILEQYQAGVAEMEEGFRGFM